jgi:putative tricarboxylic transport membrane protein
MTEPRTASGLLSPLLAAGVAVALFGAWFLLQATQLRAGPGYAAVGPRVFPTVVGIGLIASGLAVLLGALRRSPATAPVLEVDTTDPLGTETDTETDWPTLGIVAALLAVAIALFQPLGFVITSAAFLVACARALGSRSLLRDGAAGVGLAVVTYAVFTYLLGLELPDGPLAILLLPLPLLSSLPLGAG